MYNSQHKTKSHMWKEAAGVRDSLSFRGEIIVELFDRYRKLVNRLHSKNFIVDLGLETVIDILSGTVSGKIYRMAVGDSGTLVGQPYVPKTPDATWVDRTGLFHEVIRSNHGGVTQPTAKSMTFVGSFSSADIDTTSFSSSPYVINEAGLFVSDGTQTGSQQINKTPPDSVDASEKLFSMRTFKSQPFDPTDTLTLSITWTIYVQ